MSQKGTTEHPLKKEATKATVKKPPVRRLKSSPGTRGNVAHRKTRGRRRSTEYEEEKDSSAEEESSSRF